MLQFEVWVENEGEHKITDIDTEPVKGGVETVLPKGMFPIVGDDKTTNPNARGIWLAKGYGYIFEVTDSELKIYNATKKFAWEQEFDDDLYFKTGKDRNRSVFTLHPLEPGYNVDRLEELPSSCVQQTDWTPTKLFDAYVDLFDAHYPFFEVRKINWRERTAAIRPTINDDSSEQQLFDAMKAMVKDLDDGHVSLEASIDGKKLLARTGGEDTISRLRSAFKPNDEFKTFGEFFRDWRARLRESVLQTTLQGEGHEDAGDQIMWGRVHDKIGYVAINGMGGYAIGNTFAQVAELHRVMDKCLTALVDTEAIIIDISMNGGGMDLFSLEIASHFTEKRRLGFSKWPGTQKQFRNDRFFDTYTATATDGAVYTKPVYLVTSDVSASAAEIFTMCMRAIPSVTHVGHSTEGALSDILPKTLPNGWELGLSNEIYVDHKGVCHEGPGVPPQVKMDIFDPNDITKIGHAESIQRIVELILDRTNK